MALTLNEIQNRQHKKAKNKSKTDIKPNIKKQALVKPWQLSAQAKEANFNEVSDQNLAHHNLNLENSKEENILLFSSQKIIARMDDLAQKIQQNSYVITRLNQSRKWVQAIQVYPKLRVPIPKIFSYREGR